MRTSIDTRTRRAIGLAALLLLGVALWFGCVSDPSVPPLRPTGGLDNSCISELNTIHVAGDFTEPAWNIPVSPPMQIGPGCVWTALVRFTSAGDHTFKLVTNGAFDTPPDFGWNESQTLRVGVDNPVLRVSGTGTGIKLNIPVAGCYLFKLYEKDLLFRADPTSCASGSIRGLVEFENVAQPPLPRARVQALQLSAVVSSDSSEAADGTFEVPGLAAGTYDVAFKAFGYLDTTVAGVRVGESAVDIGSVRMRAGCVSAYDSIQVAGQFTNPPFDLSVSPLMRQVEGCLWEATVPVATAGTYLFKFVTAPGFDNPNDYGGDEAQMLQLDTDYPLREVSGTGTAIKMAFPFPGSFRFVLDEETRVFRVESGGIAGDLSGVLVFEARSARPLPVAKLELVQGANVEATVTSSADDGIFRFASVDAGVYDLRVAPPFRAPSHLDSTLAGVTVAGGATNVGQVFLRRATGGLQGSVGFANVTAPPWPPATVTVRRGSALAESLRTTANSPAVAVVGLKPATYDLRIAAAGYMDTTYTLDVGRAVVPLGDIALRPLICSSYPTIAKIQIGGGRTDYSSEDSTFTWFLGEAPVMEHVEPCRWRVTIAAAQVAQYFVKFICNGDFGGDPPDFGGDDTSLAPPDSTLTVLPVSVVSVTRAILIQIDNPGYYRFDLDLAVPSFRYTRTGDLPPALPRHAARRRAAASATEVERGSISGGPRR